jgi:MFS transporter, SP family, general alpha glucoside:H+ symporter
MTTEVKPAMSVTEHREDVAVMAPDATSHAVLDAHDKLGFKQAVRTYPKVSAWCLALTTAILLWGYDMIIVGSVTGVNSFQMDYGVWSESEEEWIFPAMWLGLWSAAQPIGSTFGSVFGGFVQDRLGRCRSLVLGSVICSIAIGIIFGSNWLAVLDSKRAVFFVGKVIQGFATGIIKIQVLTYISENAPTALRGSGMALVPTFTLLGQLIGAIVIYSINDVEGSRGYLIAFGSQWILSLAPFALGCIMPESPAWLIRKGRFEEAMRNTERLVAPKVDHHLVYEKTKFIIDQEASMATEVTFADCFNHANLRRTLIVIWANFIPAVFGLDLLSSASYFLQVRFPIGIIFLH